MPNLEPIDIKELEKELSQFTLVIHQRAEAFTKIAHKLGRDPNELASQIIMAFFECFGEDDEDDFVVKTAAAPAAAAGAAAKLGFGSALKSILSKPLKWVWQKLDFLIEKGLVNLPSAYVSLTKFLVMASAVAPVVPALLAGKLFAETTSDNDKVVDSLMGAKFETNELQKLIDRLRKIKEKRKQTGNATEGMKMVRL